MATITLSFSSPEKDRIDCYVWSDYMDTNSKTGHQLLLVVPDRRLLTRWHWLSMAMWKRQYRSARIWSKCPQFCQQPLLTLCMMGWAKTIAHHYMYCLFNDHLSHLAHTWLHEIENSVFLVTYGVSVIDHVSNTHTSRRAEWYGVHLFIQRCIQTSGGEIQLLVEQRRTIGVSGIMQCINHGHKGLGKCRATQKYEIQQFAAIIIHDVYMMGVIKI